MERRALQNLMDFVIFGEDRWRVTVDLDAHGVPDITYDAHGQSVLDARRAIRNIVNITRSPLSVSVIHGYRHGTAIKDMLGKENFSGRVSERYCPKGNPGATVLHIAA